MGTRRVSKIKGRGRCRGSSATTLHGGDSDDVARPLPGRSQQRCLVFEECLLTKSQALQHICEHGQFLEPLRDEISSVTRDGWSKAALYRLKLMDDFLKESLRSTQGQRKLLFAGLLYYR